jgi:hypothetical protein
VLQDCLDACFLHFSSHDELVQNEIRLIEAVDDVELTNILKVAIERQYVFVNGLQNNQLVVALIAAKYKVQAGVSGTRQ